MFKNKRLAIVIMAMVGGTVPLHASDTIWNWVHGFVSILKTRNLATVRTMRIGVEAVEEAQRRAEENLKKNDKDVVTKQKEIFYREIIANLKAKIEVQDLTLRDMQYTEWQFLRWQIPGMQNPVTVQQQEATQTMDVSQITSKPSIIGNQIATPKAGETQKPAVPKLEAPRVQPGEVKAQPKVQTPAQKIDADYAARYEQQESSGIPIESKQ